MFVPECIEQLEIMPPYKCEMHLDTDGMPRTYKETMFGSIFNAKFLRISFNKYSVTSMLSLSFLFFFLTAASAALLQHKCSHAAISCHDIPGVKVLDLRAIEVHNFEWKTFQNGDIPAANWTGLNFCNVTVTYTHPGRDDKINVQTWLPLHGTWNGRFQGTGGGGYIAGWGSESLTPAVAAGYAASSSDAGVTSNNDASTWALLKPGEVNLPLLEDFAYIALNDLALIGKAVTQSYYGKAPAHSYWTGCSTGGRQGMMLAQRYPTAFDGILALAPAINWPSFQVAGLWPQVVMHKLQYYPEPCELEFLTAAAVKACDDLDGLKDGVVSRPELCTFDARTLVGRKNSCTGKQNAVTSHAAEIAQATWNGPVSPLGEKLWYGFHQDAPLTGLPGYSLAYTNCTSSDRSSCVGIPFAVGEEWIRLFVVRDPKFDTSKTTEEQFTNIFHHSVEEHQSIIGTADPDLSAFHDAGGKILSWQGMADQLIPPDGTIQYYDQVLRRDPKAADYYRLFFVPGTYHCEAGLAPYPYESLDTLVRWVEKGEVPDTLMAVNRTSNGVGATRPLCPYPKVQIYVGGDGSTLDSFVCQ